MNKSNLDELCINTIRFLAIDAVEKAKSGHPGTPLGAASIVYILWNRVLKHNPSNPQWFDRDRFVLSAGHASAMLYALLYLTGYGLTLDDLKQFRQWDSKTPGHPEYGLTPGVETTTGPLGQGFANGIGMAIAERHLAQRYNRPGYEIINHYTYALLSDGDMEEGISSEAASLAGHLKLGKLIYLYDKNGVQQDSPTDVSFTENVSQRFEAYGWNVIGPIDGLDLRAIEQSIHLAKAQKDHPNLIICHTTIGYGSPHKAGTSAAHGEPLGEEEVKLTKESLNWQLEEPFTVPAEVLDYMRQAIERGKDLEEQWQQKLEKYRKAYPEEAQRLEAELKGDLPVGWNSGLANLFQGETNPISTRDASGKVLNALAMKVPSLVGGAADVAGSSRAILKDLGDFQPLDYGGRNIHFGLREHAMGAISSGMALHGGVIPFAGTFLIFLDYMRPPVRLAAMMKIRVIYIFTHDSIGLGEDGPTHQPVEHIMGLRILPGLVTIRPADSLETTEAWKIALMRRTGPTALILTRQKVPVLDRSELASASKLEKGGYVLWEWGTSPQVIIIGTGSEVHIALKAGKQLKEKGVAVRVVSLPSWELFEAQTEEYRNGVLPPEIRARVSIEAGTTIGWERYVGLEGKAIGITRFGASAPGQVIFQHLGFTPQNVVNTAIKLWKRKTYAVPG